MSKTDETSKQNLQRITEADLMKKEGEDKFDEKFKVLEVLKTSHQQLKYVLESIEDVTNYIKQPNSKKIEEQSLEKAKLNEELPSFNGKNREWLPYKENILELLINNKSLPDNEKLSKLKSTLTGEAKDILSDEFKNPLSLWKALEDRYDKVIQEQLEKLYNLPKMNIPSSHKYRIIIATVEASNSELNIERDILSTQLLINHICCCCDQETRNLYETKLKPKELPDFLNFLEKRCKGLETKEAKAKAQSKNKKSINK